MTKNYVHPTLYLRNRTSYDYDFCYTCVKWWYLQQIFSFFQNSDFLGFWRGKRAKNDPKFAQINSSFSSSSINAKKKSWGAPHLLHMCVIFSFLTGKDGKTSTFGKHLAGKAGTFFSQDYIFHMLPNEQSLEIAKTFNCKNFCVIHIGFHSIFQSS